MAVAIMQTEEKATESSDGGGGWLVDQKAYAKKTRA